MNTLYIFVLSTFYALSFVVPELFFVPFFMLLHFVWLQVRYVGIIAVILGVVWDMFWVLPLGFSSLLYLFFLLLLILYKNNFNMLHQVFICGIVVIFSVFEGFYFGYGLNSVSIFAFALLFFLSASELKRIREKRKISLGTS